MSKDQKNLVPRPPVVVVMGHIDHGKSTLLDYIRKAKVAAGEAGGITQHVGAYEAEHISADGKKHPITFIDTPGHAAFTTIRERGARAADIAILVVSAEDGVKPQTLEAYREIKAGKIPFVVAINKTDKPNADIDRTKTSLAENEIYVEGWGGDVPCVPISSITGAGIPELLDMLMLVADIADLKTDPSAPAHGLIIESTLDTRKGISATLLVKDGTLTTGTCVVAGNAYAPVRFIEDFRGVQVASAGASKPIRILGWNMMPPTGSPFTTVATKKLAEKAVEEFEAERRRGAPKAQAPAKQPTIAADKIKPGEKSDELQNVVIPLIVKADVIGSLEGVKHELAKIAHDRVKLDIVSEGIGDINENDIKFAQGDPSVIILGFNTVPDKKTASLIERSPIALNVKTFKIIYELVQYVQDTLTAKIPKEYVEEVTGRAKILALFSKEKDKQVVGGKVESGEIGVGSEVRITRRDADIGRGKIRELQQAKKRAESVREGFEFGMMIESKLELAPGDRVEAVRTVEKAQGTSSK